MNKNNWLFAIAIVNIEWARCLRLTTPRFASGRAAPAPPRHFRPLLEICRVHPDLPTHLRGSRRSSLRRRFLHQNVFKSLFPQSLVVSHEVA